LLFAQTKAQAQEQPSTVKRHLIGGSISFGSSKAEMTGLKSTVTNLGISPTYAYYFKDHVAIGASLTYNYNKQTSTYGVLENKSNVYYFGPFIRFEIPLWQSRFSIYNDLGVNGTYTRSSYTDTAYTTRQTAWGAGAYYEPGLMFRIKSNILLQASVGPLLAYSYTKGSGTESHYFGIIGNRNGTDNFKIGINFLF
jgi:hypothetical protein